MNRKCPACGKRAKKSFQFVAPGRNLYINCSLAERAVGPCIIEGCTKCGFQQVKSITED